MNESKEVEELLKIINAKKEIATRDNEEATIKKKQLEKDSVEINQKQQEADQILKEAIPMLEAAKEALSKIDSKELVELKALNSPPKPVGAVAAMLLLFKPIEGVEGEGWNAAR